MAGGKIRYQYQQYYSRWLEEKQGSHRMQRHLYKFLTMLTLLVAVIVISAVTGSGRSGSWQQRKDSLEGGRMGEGKENHSYTPVGSSTRRRLTGSQEEEEYEENEGVDCSNVYEYGTGPEQCRFITVTADCTSDVKFLNYMDFVFCKTGGRFKPIGTIICIFWWLFCFIGLAVTADDFYLNGVTFLAFGNGSPDVFSAIAALSSGGNPALGLGGLLGAGVFVTTVVAGTISVVTPFRAMQRPFIRDVVFYVTSVYWTFAILWRGYMYVYESIGYIVLYAIYVTIVASSGSIYKKQQQKKKSAVTQIDKEISEVLRQQDEQMKVEKESLHSISRSRRSSRAPEIPIHRRLSIEDDNIELKPLASSRRNTHDDAEGSKNANEKNDEAMDRIMDDWVPADKQKNDPERQSMNSKGSRNQSELQTPFQEFLGAINPINTDEWPEMKIHGKIYEVCKLRVLILVDVFGQAPLYFVITLTCPVVNYEEEETHNWCRYLQILQLVTAPVSAVFLVRFGTKYIGGVIPVWAVALVVGAVLAIACFFTSKNDTRPVYHDAFGFIGFLMGIIWIYTLANEIVSLLKTFGIIFNINDAILGLTLLAWGNSLGDWISDTVMAKQGFARMGFSACFGGPYFNLSIGFGGAMMISQITSGDSVRYGLAITGVSLVLIAFLMISLCFSLIFIVFILRFNIQRVYGLCLLILYITFLIMAILAACNVIFNFQ